ncbi:hypothetical protein C8F01DRAFT_1145342 [Mycena amicta]|nr:hypothetical protein C8F01DRAFT_1145342 [Mycena amicta]
MNSWRTLLCCCGRRSTTESIEDDYLVIPDETSRLLSSNGSSVGRVSPTLVAGRETNGLEDGQLIARLSAIVHAKENKMVKIGTRAAFILHRTEESSASTSAITSIIPEMPQTPSKSTLRAPSIASPDLPLQPPPSPVTPIPSIAMRHSHVHATTPKSLPRRLPIPPIFKLTPAPVSASTYTTPAVSRSNSLSGSRLLRHGRENGSALRTSYFSMGDGARSKRGRPGRMSSGDSNSTATSIEESRASVSTEDEEPEDPVNAQEDTASDVSDASGLTLRESSTLTAAFQTGQATTKYPTSNPPADVHSSIIFSWGE